MKNELVKYDPKPLLLNVRPTLRGNQEGILKYLNKVTSNGGKVRKDDILNLYKVVNENLSYYVWEKVSETCWEQKAMPMRKEWAIERAINWFFMNIGILVKKGYLKVIPAFDLSDAEISKIT